MASTGWLVTLLEARGIPKRVDKKLYHKDMLDSKPQVYVSLAIIYSGDMVPSDGRCTRRPFGMLIGYDQYKSPKAEKFLLEDGAITWNTAVTVRKRTRPFVYLASLQMRPRAF